MKKILFLIHDLGPGGAEKVLVNLVNNMDHSKFDITVMALFDGVNSQLLNDDIHYKVVFKRVFPGNSHIMKLFSPKQLHSMIIKDRYDIEVSYLEGPSARIISGCDENKTKLISWIHVEQHTLKKMAKSFRTINEMKKCYMRFDATACVSQFVFDEFTGLVPVHNPRVIYNTIERDYIISMGKEAVEDGIFQEDIITLCGVGTLKKSKGFDRLIHVHSRLIREGKRIRTIILGDGPESDSLQELTKDLGMTDSIRFLGYQTNPYKYLSRSDIFVCTSYAEGFSTAATEALILGVPVCTVEVSGMKEMLGNNNEFGIVTHNDDEDYYVQLRSLVENAIKMMEYKKRAQKRGEMFATRETVEKTEEFLLGIN